MRGSGSSLIAAASLLAVTGNAVASGDPAVLLVPAFHFALVLAFFAWLTRVPGWSRRLAASSVFFGSLLAVYLATAEVPYAANRGWLAAVLVLTPPACWLGAAIFLRWRRRGRVA